MTQEQYMDSLDTINEEANVKKQMLQEQYAKANNPHKIGDKIENAFAVYIEIEAINHATLYLQDYPECIYSGPLLKKDGTLRKDGRKGTIYQNSIV